MDCKQAESLFIGYHDGELSSEQKRELEQHLTQCDACRVSWDEYRRMIGEVSGLHQLTLSDEFVNKVTQKIRRRSKGRFFKEPGPFSVRFAIISFLLIILLILAYLFIIATKEIKHIEAPTDDFGASPEKGAEHESIR